MSGSDAVNTFFKWVLGLGAAYVAFLVLLTIAIEVKADDDEVEVTYCKDLRTGEIFIVEAGYPCPGTTVAI